MTRPSYNRYLHFLAVATVVATFPLIFMGGMVTSNGAGMSVPDWPNSYGYNMFLFPPRLWVGGILYEHSHRLTGTVVGMLVIALTIVAWTKDRRPHVRWLCAALLGAVILQGVLGGLRVVLVRLDLAIVHACVAQAFFCFAAFTAVATSRWWEVSRGQKGLSGLADAGSARALIATCLFAVAAIYAQLVVGAVMRYYNAGLAVPDFPLAYGQVVPHADAVALGQINELRVWQLNLPQVTATQVWLHMGHRFGACIVTISVLFAAGVVIARYRDRKVLLIPAIALPVLLATQITLGAFVVWKRKPADVASLHVAVGALTLLTAFVMCTASIRLFGNSKAAKTRDARIRISPNRVLAA